MFILAFLSLSGLVWLLGLLWFGPARLRLGIYSMLSLLFVLAGLILFTLLSWWVGLVRFGVPESLSIPEDYIAQGIVGLVLLLIGIVGMVSPAVAAWLVSRQPVHSMPSHG